MRSSKERREILKSISPNVYSAIYSISVLLEIVKEELAWRENAKDEKCDYGDNIYWALLLLHITESLDFVQLIWCVKKTSMDLGFGVDGQFLVGAGVQRTVLYCQRKEMTEIVAYINGEIRGDWEDSFLKEWLNAKIAYFHHR